MNVQDLLSNWSGQRAVAAIRAGDQLPFILSLVLAIAIAIWLARLAWAVWLGVLPPAERADWQPPARTTAAPHSTATGDASRRIVSAHLFGEPSAEAPEAVATTEDSGENAPDTRLNLQLRGAIAAADPKVAHAIIADASGNEKVYFVDDSIPGGVNLHRVQADRVILRRGAELEVLRLPRAGEGTTAGSVAASRPAVLRAPPSEAPTQALTDQSAGFLDIVRPQPFMPNGQLRGYRVFPGPNRQQFGALGLRPGDLVTEINGIQLNNPAQGMEVFRTLGEATDVTVTVERDGQPQVLTLNLADIGGPDGATQ